VYSRFRVRFLLLLGSGNEHMNGVELIPLLNSFEQYPIAGGLDQQDKINTIVEIF